jgi:hypothetical protein
MVELMSTAEQVDREFALARRRARLHGLRRRLVRSTGTGRLLPFEQTRRSVGAYGGFRRGRSTVEVSRIVGSAGKHDQFDDEFMPLRGASPERWKRMDRAYRSGEQLPAVSLYRLDGDYFVQDGHHRVSVARFHGAEWIDADITEFESSRNPKRPAGGGDLTPAAGPLSAQSRTRDGESTSLPPRRNS